MHVLAMGLPQLLQAVILPAYGLLQTSPTPVNDALTPRLCALNHKALATPTLLFDVRILEHEPRAQLILLPIHLTPDNAEQRFAIN